MFAAGTLSAAETALARISYTYSKNGQIASRTVNGQKQCFSYDKRGQLTAVSTSDGRVLEAYAYDPAGNILQKTVNGKTTVYTYDRANQLTSSIADGKTTFYQYDAAGRLKQEGDKTYKYSYLDKLTEVAENGKTVAGFDYYVDGQIASAKYGDREEHFRWDGLALIERNGVGYLNEPHAGGGAPIAGNGKVMLNDLLGTTMATSRGGSCAATSITAFGETSDHEVFFTGKPQIGEMGYAFLMRNYRSDTGKWQTSDPLGYPDGWNNYAYCGNHPGMAIDGDGAVWSWATGALGAGLSVAGYAASCWLTGEEMTTAGVAGAAAGGFVAGAVAGALIGDPSAATVSALLAAGAISGAAGQLTNNVVSTALDPNQQYNYATLTDGILRNALLWAITDVLPLNKLLASMLGFEVGVLDNFYAYAKNQILNALNQLDQQARERLMQQEALME